MAGGGSAPTGGGGSSSAAGGGGGGFSLNFLSKFWMTILGGSRSGLERPELGDVWSTPEAIRQHCRSTPLGAGDVRVCFRNRCDHPLVLCWVDHDGKLHHFRRLDPTAETGLLDHRDHLEHSSVGHAFVLAYAPPSLVNTGGGDEEEADADRDADACDRAIAKIQKDKYLDGAILVGGYRTKQVGCDDGGHGDALDEDDAMWRPHLVEISPIKSWENCDCGGGGGGGPYLRGSTASEDKAVIPKFKLTVSLGKLEPRPLDTTTKVYKEMTLGGWPVRLDAALEENKTPDEEKCLRELEADLEVLCLRLPDHARQRLCQDTPLWINRTLRYGPTACPVRGIGCCYHPGAGWLKDNGLTTAKEGCVELYDLAEYGESRGCWGVGGVMLHEYAHAYHHKCLEDGYENKPLQECWERNMKEKKYDCVAVHGSQGPTAKAYACTDPMEYFAELSSAFLGGLSDEEYNKWFPFNRKQVEEHDPRAYQLLQELWKVQPEEETGTKGKRRPWSLLSVW